MKNKEWLKNEISRMSYVPAGLDESNSIISTNWVLNFANQLEEPEREKVTIPDFIVEYIESLKYRGLNFYSGYRHAERCSNNGKNNIQEWLDSEENLETFARAWLDGYKVEKEPQWVVKDDTGYLSYLRFSIPNIYERETSLDKNDAYKFNSKSKADLIADLVTGTVEEVTD